ncbi:hypothetical protein [Micromonospora sp. RL09-050-HVF-A]|uniref:hypothetical protein n=1 Tax=Micromonospora sp. RL09-050-HVF-A TaxID=1703433 RepID=UPI001C5D49EC|nr:hypothetical protein [Micromonospora sp. RL09-050-HVF-A]MBW4700834.1 hypothetical protein [Micromonospora sp. RL09-050-HVF-A]
MGLPGGDRAGRVEGAQVTAVVDQLGPTTGGWGPDGGTGRLGQLDDLGDEPGLFVGVGRPGQPEPQVRAVEREVAEDRGELPAAVHVLGAAVVADQETPGPGRDGHGDHPGRRAQPVRGGPSGDEVGPGGKGETVRQRQAHHPGTGADQTVVHREPAGQRGGEIRWLEHEPVHRLAGHPVQRHRVQRPAVAGRPGCRAGRAVRGVPDVGPVRADQHVVAEQAGHLGEQFDVPGSVVGEDPHVLCRVRAVPDQGGHGPGVERSTGVGGHHQPSARPGCQPQVEQPGDAAVSAGVEATGCRHPVEAVAARRPCRTPKPVHRRPTFVSTGPDGPVSSVVVATVGGGPSAAYRSSAPIGGTARGDLPVIVGRYSRQTS